METRPARQKHILCSLPLRKPTTDMDGDSPLSITSNIIGLLTFLAAVGAGSYARALTFQAKLRYRDEILKAMLDTLGAFSETCTLAVCYDKLKNEEYMPHDEFDKILVNLYMSIFELMAIFLDLGCKKSVSAARAVSKRSVRWKNMISEIEGQISKVRQILFFARLQDNILGHMKSDSSSSQDMRTNPSEETDEIREDNEGVRMPTINIQNTLAPGSDESIAIEHRPLRVYSLILRAWSTVCHESFESPDSWQRREKLLKEIWESLPKKPHLGPHSELLCPITLYIAVIYSITSAGRQKLRQISSKKKGSTPLTNDTEAQKSEKAGRAYPSRIQNSYLVGLAGSGVSFFKMVFMLPVYVLLSVFYSPVIFDTNIERNGEISLKVLDELIRVMSGTGEMNPRWVIILKHMLEED